MEINTVSNVYLFSVILTNISYPPQILYAGEGESRKPDENSAPSMGQGAHAGSTVGLAGGSGGEDGQTVIMKGHEFVQASTIMYLNHLGKIFYSTCFA